jgi:hypothetical protein
MRAPTLHECNIALFIAELSLHSDNLSKGGHRSIEFTPTKAVPAVVAIVWALTSQSVFAQQPTPEQMSAIRANCRSDFMANCSGVQRGGKDALECLKGNLGKLSGGCQAAVSAISPAPAPAAAPVASAPAAPIVSRPPAPRPATAPKVVARPPAAAPRRLLRRRQPQPCRRSYCGRCYRSGP